MKKIWNLPRVELASFGDIQETQPVLLVTSVPAWNAVKASLRGLNIVETITVKEAQAIGLYLTLKLIFILLFHVYHTRFEPTCLPHEMILSTVYEHFFY